MHDLLSSASELDDQGKIGLYLMKKVVFQWIRGVAKTEALIYQEILCVIMKRDLPSSRLASLIPVGSRFPLANGPISSLLLPLAIIGLLSDLPMSFVAIAILKPTHELSIHLIVFGISVWILIWMTGYRSAIKHLNHVVNNGAIHLRVGFRWSVNIPTRSILRCTQLTGKPREWLHDLSIDRTNVLMVTPADSPNVLIELIADQLDRIQVNKMGVTVPVRQFVAFYVDNPSGFLNNVLAAGATAARPAYDQIAAEHKEDIDAHPAIARQPLEVRPQPADHEGVEEHHPDDGDGTQQIEAR